MICLSRIFCTSINSIQWDVLIQSEINFCHQNKSTFYTVKFICQSNRKWKTISARLQIQLQWFCPFPFVCFSTEFFSRTSLTLFIYNAIFKTHKRSSVFAQHSTLSFLLACFNRISRQTWVGNQNRKLKRNVLK